MELTTTKKVVLFAVYSVTLVAIGRYTAPTKIEIRKEIVTVIQKDTTVQDKTKKHKDTKTVVVTNPDGSKTETTETAEDENKDISKDTKESEKTDTTETKIVTAQTGNLSISALAGVNVGNPASGIAYGASVQRNVIGPITIGIWGLVNPGMAGASVGLSF